MTTATRSAPRKYTYGPEVCDWIEENCVLPSGDMAGQPFRLMAWQREWISELFETDVRGKLKHRWALLGVPKGNGKSPLVAALALYHLLGDPDEEDPWVVVAAAGDKQADIVFEAAKTICRLSPSLNAITTRYRWEIRPKDGLGKMERVAASKGRLDGKLISFLVMDELHEWVTENWVVLTGGALKRKRSQIVQITTAGYDRESICFQEYERGRRIQAGEARNASYSFRWYEAPKDADYKDPRVWEACNPAYGVLVHPSVLRQALSQGESAFRRYRLNQWVESESIWLPQGAWAACRVERVELEPHAPTWVGWDAATKRDSTAVVAVQQQGERVVVSHRIWSRPFDAMGDPVDDWTLPIAEVEEHVAGLFEKYDVVGCAYDPAFITWSAETLAARGLEMIEWPQSDSRMVPATQALYELITSGELAHDGDPTMAKHIAAVVAKQTRAGGQRMGKGQQSRQIDLAIALAMAVGLKRDKPVEPKVEAKAWFV